MTDAELLRLIAADLDHGPHRAAAATLRVVAASVERTARTLTALHDEALAEARIQEGIALHKWAAIRAGHVVPLWPHRLRREAAEGVADAVYDEALPNG